MFDGPQRDTNGVKVCSNRTEILITFVHASDDGAQDTKQIFALMEFNVSFSRAVHRM